MTAIFCDSRHTLVRLTENSEVPYCFVGKISKIFERENTDKYNGSTTRFYFSRHFYSLEKMEKILNLQIDIKKEYEYIYRLIKTKIPLKQT